MKHVNVHIINNLANQTKKLKPNDSLCSLVFDEIAIEPATEYNIKEDFIFSFENFGVEKTTKLCDHVCYAESIVNGISQLRIISAKVQLKLHNLLIALQK